METTLPAQQKMVEEKTNTSKEKNIDDCCGV